MDKTRERQAERERGQGAGEEREREMMRAMYCNTVNATISSIF